MKSKPWGNPTLCVRIPKELHASILADAKILGVSVSDLARGLITAGRKECTYEQVLKFVQAPQLHLRLEAETASFGAVEKRAVSRRPRRRKNAA